MTEVTTQFLSVDPGDLTGWSVLADPGGHEIAHGILSYEEMPSWISKFSGFFGPTERVVIEDFALFKHRAKQQSGSKFKTVKVIGMFELWVYEHRIPIIYQNPQCKDRGSQFSGRKPPSDHRKSHDVDAYNHGAYYLHLNNRFALPNL